jgi:hypothetical protein
MVCVSRITRLTVTILGLITLKSHSLIWHSAGLFHCSDPPAIILQLIITSNKESFALDACLWPELEQLMVKPGQWSGTSFSRSTLILTVSGVSFWIILCSPRVWSHQTPELNRMKITFYILWHLGGHMVADPLESCQIFRRPKFLTTLPYIIPWNQKNWVYFFQTQVFDWNQTFWMLGKPSVLCIFMVLRQFLFTGCIYFPFPLTPMISWSQLSAEGPISLRTLGWALRETCWNDLY